MRDYRSRMRERGIVPAADRQDKQNARRAAKRAAGVAYYDSLKKRAQNVVNNEVRRGRLERQPCEVCGNPRSHAHHDDYSQPLMIRWLCHTHHEEHHHGSL